MTLLPVIITGTACFVLWQWPEKAGMLPGSLKHSRWLTGLGVATAGSLLFSLMTFFSSRAAGRQQFDRVRADVSGDDIPVMQDSHQDERQQMPFFRLNEYLRRRYGLFWRYRIRLLLVTGEETEIAALFPHLAEKQWLEGYGTVVIYGGSLHEPPDTGRLLALRKLRRSRPLDGIILALNVNHASRPQWMDDALRTLEQTGDALRYQPPVYLWQVCDGDPSQDGRITQPVGAFFPHKVTSQAVSQELVRLLPQLREQGMRQVCADNRHDFLLRLGQWLQAEGAARWQHALTPWLSGYGPRIPLRGLMFSLPVAEETLSGAHEHRWSPGAVFQAVLDDCGHAPGRPVGFPRERVLCYLLLAVIAAGGAGSLASFSVNYHRISIAAQTVRLLTNSHDVSDAQLTLLHDLRNDIGRIQAQEKTAWWRSFGLNHDEELLRALLPWYGQANNRLIRDAASQVLYAQLNGLINQPPGSPQRARMAKPGYDQLKAWLMMGRPEKADAAFYAQAMKAAQPSRAGISPGLWQGLAPDLWAFYMQQLPAQPSWKITPDAQVVAAARRVLLEQIGQRNGEDALYHNILDAVSRNYADLTLAQMTGNTDASPLFGTADVVPGTFTRQAWEGQVQEAIDNAVTARREEIDWVLSDNRKTITTDVSPEALKQRLTERYFTDYAATWLKFLNSLRWKPAHNLSDVTDQLTLMSDVRQSPLIALMNTLTWQGQAGRTQEALSDSLVKSAGKLLQQEEDKPVIDQQIGEIRGPLDATFGPLLAITGKGSEQSRVATDDSLSFQMFLTRVTRVRLKLRQITNAPDPQAMMQQVAQTVFQGKNIDLTDAREYGSLLAAGMGEEWSGFGDTMFVQPLAQAWEQVLQPSATGLNESWRNAVVTDWTAATDGRYPISQGRSDIPLPVLAEFIRRDTGRIDRFLNENLTGLMHREGRRWVVDKLNAQGLTLNPAFVRAVNLLGEVRDALFTDGSQGMRFELRARPVPEVAETMLTLDGQPLHYFNQMESWQSFRWPGETEKPGATLTWTTTDGGANLYGDYPGDMGVIRWLEQGQAKKRDDGVWQLTFAAPDGKKLTWLLRTGPGDGPLALLKLRDFTLPENIFITGGQAAQWQDGDASDDDGVQE
ncbi:type VI secretion protein VasK [Salmonella enterica subsp. enterica]|nr:type VI secretion protein VasK [Salmonella enterica subsp. enterica]